MMQMIRWLCNGSMLAIFAMGLSKLLDLPAFERALLTWSALPKSMIPFIAIVVPITEAIVPSLLFFGVRRKRIVVGLFVFVAFMTLAYGLHWWLLSKPTCGCLGAISTYYHELEEGWWTLGRNFVILLGLGAGMFSLGRDDTKNGTSSKNDVGFNSRMSARGAFTLVELLLVISLIGILITMSLPALGRVRQQAKITVSMNNLRTHGTAFVAYAGDFRDLMPYATTPVGTSIIRCQSHRIAVSARYFEMANLWSIAMADGYYGGNPWSKSFGSPLNPFAAQIGSPFLGTNYYYSCAFLTSPEYYNSVTRMKPVSQFRAVRLSEVLFASSKTIHAEYMPTTAMDLFDNTSTTLGGFCDGHVVKATAQPDLTYHIGDGYPASPALPNGGYGGHLPASTYPLTHTLYGVRGRDVQ